LKRLKQNKGKLTHVVLTPGWHVCCPGLGQQLGWKPSTMPDLRRGTHYWHSAGCKFLARNMWFKYWISIDWGPTCIISYDRGNWIERSMRQPGTKDCVKMR
jgi:hypothetical protein